MAAPPGNQQAPFRRPPTSPRGRPTPKRSRSFTGPRDHADNGSLPPQKRRQCSREEYAPVGRGGDDRDAGPRQLIDSYRPNAADYFEDDDNYHSPDEDDGDNDDDSKASIPVRLGNHRVLPPTGIQIRGGASVRENGHPHPGIKQEPGHYNGNRSPPKPLVMGRPLLDRRSNDIFWNLPPQYHDPFTILIKALDDFLPDLEDVSGPEYADSATYEAYKALRHLAGLTHSLHNRKGPGAKMVEDLRNQVAEAKERNETLSAEIRSLKKDASVVNMTKDREAIARGATIKNEHDAELTRKTAELVANVERLEREVQAKKEDRANSMARIAQLEKDAQAGKIDKARVAGGVIRLESEVQEERDDKAKLAESVARLESELQAEKDDKTKLAQTVGRLEEEAQAMRDDKAKLEAMAEQTAKERHSFAMRLQQQTELGEIPQTSLPPKGPALPQKPLASNPPTRFEVSSFKNTLNQLRERKAILSGEVAALRKQNSTLAKDNDMLQGKVRGLTEECDSLKERVRSESLRNQTTALAEDKDRLQDQVRGLSKECNSLKDRVRESDSLRNQVCDLAREKEKLNDSIRSLLSEKQGFKCQALALQKSEDELRGKVRGLTGEKDNLATENSRLNEQIVDLNKSKEVYLAKINTLGRVHKALVEEKGTLDKLNKDLDDKVKVLNTKIDSLAQELRALLGERKTIVKSNKALDDKVMLLNTDVYRLSEENKGLAGDKERLSKENGDLNAKVRTLTADKERYITTVNNVAAERNSLNKLLAKKDSEIEQKDSEIKALRARAVTAVQQQESGPMAMQGAGQPVGLPNGHGGEPGRSAQEPSPYIKQEPRQFQLPTPTTSSGPGLPRVPSRAISIDTLPSPSPGPGQVQVMTLPVPEPSDLSRLSHLNDHLSSMIRKLLEWNISQSKVVIDFVVNSLLLRIAADSCRPAVTQAKGHWEVQEPWLTGEALALQARVRHVTNDSSVEDQFMRLCPLIENLRNPARNLAQAPNLLLGAIPSIVASLIKADVSSSPTAAMAFLETLRALPPPVAQPFNTQRAALALMICELCRVLERTLPEAKRSIWKIGSILGPEAQAAAEKLPIGKLADNLSYGSSAHLTKTHLAAECGDRFCLLPVPGAEGRPAREIGLLYPGGENREGEAEEGQYFLMIDFAGPALRLVESKLADMKDMRTTKADFLKYDLAISRDEGGREVELFHVAAAPKKVFMFWVNYVQPGFK